MGEKRTVLLAGNPNVGKSSLFNKLTGLRRHTGNWAGKTVETASGSIFHNGTEYIFTDLPGTYSLLPHSREEEIARDFILTENPDVVVVVCDASCLERNLNLVLQTAEITNRIVVCVNLLDEAHRRQIDIDLSRLSSRLGCPVCGTVAKNGTGLNELLDTCASVIKNPPSPLKIKYTPAIESALSVIEENFSELSHHLSPRWIALRILEEDSSVSRFLPADILSESLQNIDINNLISECSNQCTSISDTISSCTVLTAEYAACGCVTKAGESDRFDRKIDKIVTGKIFGIPIMLVLLSFILWLTISFANVPSQMLSEFFAYLEPKLLSLLSCAPRLISEPLVFGIYRVLTWVISVMLPPMAIFFPLFTLLEDLGYLPRIAFNLDKCFKKCAACGKQALTMCMGFGCNAVGVTGCRIIDSPRERLIAILTNCFVPCNGRFPTLISVITMFLVFPEHTVSGTIFLTLFVLLGIFVTLLVSRILSKTLLRGTPSFFTLELPPYRLPNVFGVILRSISDRIVFVLFRAIAVASPAGLIIWILANVRIGDDTLLYSFSQFLDPFGKFFGMDGSIILAFILGFPANEIVIPLIAMSYTAGGILSDSMSTLQLRELFISNGWSFETAINVILFSLMHWPCSTTLLTIKKETGSLKWTIAAFLLPTFLGLFSCFIFTRIAVFL